MEITWIQHVPYEGLGAIGDWADSRGFKTRKVSAFDIEDAPPPDQATRLVVMGGPMGLSEIDTLPWMRSEVALISRTLDAGGRVLGVCLGAQLLAHALGAEVRSGVTDEVGWYPVNRDPTAGASPVIGHFPEEFTPFHWHSDMFTIPEGATPLGSSERCPNQGFAYGRRAVGLQFHIELRRSDLSTAIDGGHLPPEVLDGAEERISTLEPSLHILLDRLFAS